MKLPAVKLSRSGRNNNSSCRQDALAALQRALDAAEPEAIVKHSLKLEKEKRLRISNVELRLEDYNRILVIGAGKASARMAIAVEQILGPKRISGGVVNIPDYLRPWPKSKGTIEFHEATHPIPTQEGVAGVQKMLDLVGKAPSEEDLVICLISGGGSSLLPLPKKPLTLADIQNTTNLLLRSGAEINEINTIRKHLSSVKGGRLAEKLFPATVLSLIISDVVGDKLDAIASGPTAPDPTTYSDALQILQKYNLWERVSKRVREEINAGAHKSGKSGVLETPKPSSKIFKRVHNVLVGTNLNSCIAASECLKDLGYHTIVLSTHVQGEAKEIGKLYSGILRGAGVGIPLTLPFAIVAGGETTVTISGHGKGGRNQELVLSASFGLSGESNVAVASMGTDGVDGPTDAAGAIVDGETLSRAEKLKLDPRNFLDTHNSYKFFKNLGDLIVTGATGTNVNDITVLVAGNKKFNSKEN